MSLLKKIQSEAKTNNIYQKARGEAQDFTQFLKTMSVGVCLLFTLLSMASSAPSPSQVKTQNTVEAIECGEIQEKLGDCKEAAVIRKVDTMIVGGVEVEAKAPESEEPKPEEKKEEEKKEEPKEEPKEEVKVEEKKVEKVKEEQKLAPEPAPQTSEQTNFVARAVQIGVSQELAEAMQTAAREYEIKPEYLLAIGLSENALAPNEIGDSGWSYGPFQIYLNVHKHTDLHPSIMDCAKDFLCSSRWTARRVRNSYLKVYGDKSWILALSKHNGQVYCPKNPKNTKACFVDEITGPLSYQAKIEKNGLKAGLTF